MQEKVHLQRFPVQYGRFQRVVFISQLQGEERSVFVDETEEDLVAFPHGKLKQAFFLDPFEVALVAFNLVAGPVGADEDVHVFVVIDIMHEGDDATVAPFRHGEASLLRHLA